MVGLYVKSLLNLKKFFFANFLFLITYFNFIYFWLHWVFIAACGLSLAVVSGGCSLVMALGLLIAVASLVAGHRP